MWRRAKDVAEARLARDSAEDGEEESKDAKGSGRPRASSSKPVTLFSLGLPKLRQWLEEDEDRLQEKLKEASSDKLKEKKMAFEGFVKNKDR